MRGVFGHLDVRPVRGDPRERAERSKQGDLLGCDDARRAYRQRAADGQERRDLGPDLGGPDGDSATLPGERRAWLIQREVRVEVGVGDGIGDEPVEFFWFGRGHCRSVRPARGRTNDRIARKLVRLARAGFQFDGRARACNYTSPSVTVNPRRLTRTEARRIAIRAQVLSADRPRDLGAVVDRLTFLQLDPTAVVAPSADLVAWSRLGNAYATAHLQHALERDRTLFEHRSQPTQFEPPSAMVRPMADLGLFLTDLAASGSSRRTEWLAANDAFRRRVLDLLRASGPLASRDIPDTSAVAGQSSGWTHDRNVTQMLEFLLARGEVGVAGRRGRQRVWDLAERIYPPGLAAVPADEARRIRGARWLRALGVARPKVVGEAGIPAEIEGAAGVWRLDPEATAEGFAGRTAVLSPFDRLIHDRARALALFDFDYTLEMYKRKANRRWGYFALPVLHDDQLIGKVDASADRDTSVLNVHAVHQDVPFTRAMDTAVQTELESLAQWLGLGRVARA
jgi:uncharacterized protein YcaQ